jgi:hypothetical protein
MGGKKSNTIARLFEETKLVGFGRYVLRVPLETKINFGTTIIGNGFEIYEGKGKQVFDLLREKWDKILYSNSSATLISQHHGPVSGGGYFWYFASEGAKEENLREYYGVFPFNDHAFVYKGGGVGLAELEKAFAKQTELIKSLRYRKDDELPQEAGVCLPFSFVSDETYSFQERFDAGIYLPSLPDVRFFVSSNVGARIRDDEHLLNSIKEQRKDLGSNYPVIHTLREGKKTVGVWDGEESLVTNKDKSHEFDWEFVGKQRSVAFPGSLSAGLRSKVAKDLEGAAKTVSLTDEEAIELWDKLLDSLAFRVPVPGASRAEMEINHITFHPGDTCPLTGMWQAVHPKLFADHRNRYFIRQGEEILSKTWFSRGAKLQADEVVMKLIKVTPDTEQKG